MTNQSRLLAIRLVTMSLVLAPCLLLVDDLKVAADINKGYVPPPNRGRVQRTEAGGSRGCNKNYVALNLLVPSDHIGTTVSTHPSFLWYVSAVPSVPMHFTLVEQDGKSILETQVQVKKPGIVKLQLPSNVPDLAIGKQYRWTVSLICNEKRPSSNILAQAMIKRVAKTYNFKKELAATNEERVRAKVYAQSSIWYDAIATSYQASNNNEQEQSTVEYFIDLLNSIGLTHIAAEEQLWRRNIVNISRRKR